MGLFGFNIFDSALEGNWDENSSCGFNKNCKAAKECIASIGGPARALYGESVYNPIAQACQHDPRPKSLDDVFCVDPKNAWEVWGYKCKSFTPPPETASGLKIGGTTINWYIIGMLVVLLIILLILFVL